MGLTGNILEVYSTIPQSSGSSLNNGSGAGTLGSDTNGVTIYTAGSNGSRVYGLFLSSASGPAGGNVFLYIKNGANIYPIGQINMPSGTNGRDALSPTYCPGLPLDDSGRPYLELTANATLKMSALSTLAVGDVIYASAIGSNY